VCFVDDEGKYYQTGDIIAHANKHDGYDVYTEIFGNFMNVNDDPVHVVRCNEHGKPYETNIVKLNNRVSELEAELKKKSEQLAKVKSMLVPTLERRKFKILVVGDAGVGKSAFIKRHLTGEFIKQYIPDDTMNCCLKFSTNYGILQFDIVDMCGQEILSHNYTNEKDVDGVIMMCSTISKISCNNIKKHFRPKVIKELGNVKRLLCCNKVDVSDTVYSPLSYVKDEIFYFISAKNNYNCEKPFLSLAKQFTGKKDLVFTPE
jgi:GTP-binding nuclear protein Ran